MVISIEDLLDEPNKSVNLPYLEEAFRNCPEKIEIELDYCDMIFRSDFELRENEFFIRYTATKKHGAAQ
jgi:hypothetical protein